MEVNRLSRILKTFDINKYYYANDWFVDGKIMINEIFYLEPLLFDNKKYNIHINSVIPLQINQFITECLSDKGFSYKIWSLSKKGSVVENMYVKIDLDKLIKLLEDNGYEDNNIKQKEIFLNNNFQLKPNDFE